MPVRDAHRSLAVLMATCLALALAASLAACSGAPEERPAPAATAAPAASQPTETPSPPPVATVAPTSAATPTPVATAAPAETPSPTAFRYDTYDTTGAVTTPGNYAFLEDPAATTSAVTTYEALRDGTTTALLIHKSDAHGASQAALYDAVAAGDLFEWREADDCFVRYKVTEVKPDPAGTAPRKLLAVEWMTYAFTGCSGTVSADTVATVDWGELPDLGGVSLTVPIRHGTWQLVPVGWAGSIELDRLDLPPVQSIDLYRDDPDGFFSTADPVVARRELPYWRDPALPAGLRLYRADSGTWDGPLYGYCAEWGLSDRYGPAIHICGYHAAYSGLPTTASQLNGRLAYMTGIVAGRAAMLEYYSPAGSNQTPTVLYGLRIYDVATQSGYELHVEDPSFDVIAIARSLFEPPNPLPPPTTFRYDTYDTYDLTGEVTEPGSYAFLADPADTTSAVTTYEALRDGTTTALLIHTSDAHGASQAALYDGVAAGDLFEWHEADDCFVRYKVTEVDAGNGNVREFAIKSYSHTYTGCSGAIGSSSASGSAGAQSTERQFTWSPEVLKTGAFTAPTWHGPWLLVPENWTGPVPETEPFTPPPITWPPSPLPTFELGAGWTGGIGPGLPPWELEGLYSHTDGGFLDVYIFQLGGWPIDVYRLSDTYDAAGVIHEFRMIDGRPAQVAYERVRTGISHAYVAIFDETTGLIYSVRGGPKSRNNDPEATIEIAKKFILPPAGPPPTTFRYDTYDTTGAVAEPGSYAFLEDPADTTSAVTTYEALRDGTTTALLIHKSDAHGASQAALYDAVEAGDLFEWREADDTFEWRYADDCWTGYRVTGVEPDPTGAAPRKLFALEPYGYAYTGCSGADASDASSVAMWREPLAWGGPDLAYPVVYGVFQVVPEGWTGELDLGGYMAAPGDSADNPGITESLTEARQLPYWRDLPGWTLDWASTGGLDAPVYGYCARLSLADRAVGVVEVCASHAAGRANPSRTKDRFGATVEVRVVNGYAALVSYFPRTSSNWSRISPIEATVYNAAAESVHTIVGWSESLSGSNVEAVLAVARTMFPD